MPIYLQVAAKCSVVMLVTRCVVGKGSRTGRGQRCHARDVTLVLKYSATSAILALSAAKVNFIEEQRFTVRPEERRF